MKLEFSLQNFEKYSNIYFHDYPSGWTRVVPSGQTGGRTDGQTNMKLKVAFRNVTDTRNKGNFTGPRSKNSMN